MCMTKVISVDDVDVVEQVVEVLKSGGIVMHPTETCYGLACDVFNEEAVQEIYDIKRRDAKNPMSIMVAGRCMAMLYGDFPISVNDIMSKYWPGALSILVPRKVFLPEYFNRGSGFVAIRYSDDYLCTSIVNQFGRPIVTTSANVAGNACLYKPDVSVFGKNASLIDLVVDGGDIEENKPSTIIKVVGDDVEVVRRGSVVIQR